MRVRADEGSGKRGVTLSEGKREREESVAIPPHELLKINSIEIMLSAICFRITNSVVNMTLNQASV